MERAVLVNPFHGSRAGVPTAIAPIPEGDGRKRQACGICS